jgi:DNA-binding PadR family transcriptional regulator
MANLDGDADLAGLYRTLRGLELEGFVRSTWDITLGGPARRIYTITPAGRRLLKQWATALRRTRTTIEEFLELYEGATGPERVDAPPGATHV